MKRRPMNPNVRAAVMERDHHVCGRCGFRATEVHHRLYRSRGGTDDLLNLVALCQTCHMAVHSASEWPWVVQGYMDRQGRYVGSEPDYLLAFGDGRAA